MASRVDEIEKAFDECWIGEMGYQKVNGKPGHLEINEEEAQTITELFRAFLREGSVFTIKLKVVG